MRKSEIVAFKPASSSVLGVHSRTLEAKEMSGFRWIGSSSGNWWKASLDFDSVSRRISSASVMMVISLGLPIFTGPVNSGEVEARLISADTVSST